MYLAEKTLKEIYILQNMAIFSLFIVLYLFDGMHTIYGCN